MTSNQPPYQPPPAYGPPSSAQAGPPPPPAFAPQSGNPADPPRVSPPPPPVTQVAPTKAPPIAWLVPLGAALAVIGAILPWFDPTATYQGQNILTGGDKLYSWKDGKIGLLAPIVLVVVAVSVVSLLQGKARGRFASGAEPVKSVAKFAIGAGAASIVCLVIAWFLLPGQFSFSFSDGTHLSWNQVEAKGATLGHGPQLGYWLTGIGALLAIVGGLIMLITYKPIQTGPTQPYGQPPAGYPQQQGGFPPPQAGYPQQQAGYPQGGAYPQQQTGYPPQGGYQGAPQAGGPPSFQKPPSA